MAFSWGPLHRAGGTLLVVCHRGAAGTAALSPGSLLVAVRRGRVALPIGLLFVQVFRRHGAVALALCHARVRGGWVLPELGPVARRGGDGGGRGGVRRGSSVGPRARIVHSGGWLRCEGRSGVGVAHRPTERSSPPPWRTATDSASSTSTVVDHDSDSSGGH